MPAVAAATTAASAGFQASALQSAAMTGSASTISAQSMLTQIFGVIASDPMSALNGGAGGAGGADILGMLFSYINIGLLTLGSLYLSYKSLVAITQTAHDGNFMGKAFHSIWVPLRVVTGVFSLLPVFGGWSVLQVLMLWFGVLGAGLGNLAWQSTESSFMPISSISPSTTTGSSFSPDFAPEVFKMYACVDAVNANNSLITSTFKATAWGVSPPRNSPLQNGTQVVSFGALNGTFSQCGAITFTKGAVAGGGTMGSYSGSLPTSSMYGGSDLAAMGVTTQAQENLLTTAAETAFTTLQASLSSQAQTYVTGVAAMLANPTKTTAVSPYSPQGIAALSATYQQSLTTAIASAMQGADMTNNVKAVMNNSATQDGFTAAGAWYTTMASMSYAISHLSEGVGANITIRAPNPSSPVILGNDIYLKAYNQIIATEKSQQIDTTANAPATGTPSSSGAWQKLVAQIGGSNSWFTSPGQATVNWFVTDNSNQPVILRMKSIADNMIVVAEVIMTAIGGIEGYKSGLAGQAEQLVASGVSGGGSDAVIGMFQPWLDFGKLLAQLSIGGLAMMSVYLPMVPFIVFMGQVVTWLLSVIEGVAAAPFLAFAHLDASGEEGLGQRTQYGYTFMLQSFMRPVMLVFGFIVASKTLDVMGGYLMHIYPMVLANVQVNSMTGLLSIIMFVFVFLFLSVALVNSAMSIMYILPDAIWSFMGAQTSQAVQIGRNTADTASKMTSGITEIAGGRAIAGGFSSRKADLKQKIRDAQGKAQQDKSNEGVGGAK